MILETLMVLGLLIGGVAGTGYLGILLLGKVDDMNRKKEVLKNA